MGIFERLTDAEISNDVVREMEKRYTNAYLMVMVAGNKPQLAKYMKYIIDVGFCFFFPRSGQQMGIPFDYNEGDIVEFNPKRGWYRTEDGKAVYYKRHAYRQWRRGISSENSSLSQFRTKLALGNYNVDAHFHRNILALMSEPDYNINTAITACETYGECPLTVDFLVTAHINKEKGHLLWYHNNIVGEIDVLGKRILVQNEIYWQEVIDIQQRLFPYLILKDC